MLELFLNLGLPIALVVLAMVVGTILERRHFASIRAREAGFAQLPTLSTRDYPTDRPIAHSQLVMGSVVVSVDHFKRLLAGLRRTFGGELHAYGSLLDRGRREALLRLQESCSGADLVVNVRLETSSISKGAQGAIGSVEVLAYGTALWFDTNP